MSASEASSLQVVNNFVEVQHLPELLRGRGGWSYGIYPGLLGDAAPSWHIHLCGSRKAHERAIHDDVLAATPGMEPLHELWRQIKDNLAQDYGLVRAYVTGHTHGQDGLAHHYAKPSDQERVALLYASTEWKDDWAGETVFYDTARECISIRPRPGRLVLFDGAVTRASRAPARECPTLCSTITFHMRRVRR